MAQQPSRVNPPLDLTRDAFALNGGLDLVSPKISVSKGSLIDGYNREIIDRIGYKRIDGFEPFDGRVNPAQTEYYFIEASSFSGTLSSSFPAGTLLIVEDDTSTIFGVVVATSAVVSPASYKIFYARINEDAEPTSGQVVNAYGTTTPDFTVNASGVQVCSEDLGENARQIVDRFNTYNTTLRSRITDLDDTPIGLHWFRDRLYAVVDDASVYFTQTGGTATIYPNSLLSKDAGASTARVLDIQLTSGTWAAGTASGIMQIEVLTGTWGTSGAVTVTNPSLATTFSLRSGTASDPLPQYASLWRTKSEQQAIDEGGSAGWSRIDLGYEIEYEDGLSDTGGFTVVSRGSDNNFTYESNSVLQFPSTIVNGNNVSGTTFAPASQVFTSFTSSVTNGDPGWKTNASSTTYASSSELVTALENADANFAYANVIFQSLALNSPYGAGVLVAADKGIADPTTSFFGGSAQPTAVGTETFDSDFLTTQARAPLFLKDFSGVAANIPEGSIIVGIEVSIPSYSVQSYVYGDFQADRNGTDGANIVSNTITFLDGAFSWYACLATANNATSSALAGSVQSTSLAFPTTSYQSSIVAGTETDSFRMAATLTGQSATIGGATNNFGNSSLTRTDLLNTSLGIAVYAGINSAPVYPLSPPMTTYPSSGSTTFQEFLYGTIRIKLDRITVRFYYTTPSARYYVGDGAGNVCSIDVTYYVQEDGSFSAGTAEGTLQFTNIQTPMGETKRTVQPNDKIFLTEADANANTNPVATVVGSGAEYNGLPSRNRIVEQASRYEFITANFFGRDEWDGFYGVSGAGRAFSFATYNADNSLDGSNEDYLIQITTSTLDRAGDIPRHIAFHHYALALGFRSGIVRFSVPGEPENFDGVDGAAEVGVGDRVTGLLSMRGTVLGVFCENSIWGVAGTDADNYQTQVLAPYTGAIEYTVVDMGIPVYCDSRGISTLEQSEKYGNFLGQRLSAPVTPWILPRMIRNNAQFSGKGVVCAIPFRAKNQYVLFFKDGEVLCMTMNPDGPSFTYRNYYIGQSTLSDTTKFLVPFAWSSQVDEKGVDRVHVSHFSPLSAITTSNGKFVYEMDQGWGFAGNFIPAEYVINWFYQDPFTEVTLKKVRLDGLTQGVSSCSLFVGKDYDSTFSTNSSDISLPRNPLDSYSVEFVPATTMTNTNLRGRSMSLKVVDVIPSGDSITDPIPPDVHQAMMVQFDPGGKIDN